MALKWNPEMTKISNFGSALQGTEAGYFEWFAPTAFDQLNLVSPLKLEAVYVKWFQGSALTGIQLEFEGGLKSELFASG